MVLLLVMVLVLLTINYTSALNLGELCDSSPIYSATWQYDDSCANVYLFCDPFRNNTCNYKGCSNTDYIQEWDESVYKFPIRCNGNQEYCPDNGSQCTLLVPVGGHCELQRDDECAGKNSVCLNSTCFLKGSPLGGYCGSDRTDYVSYDAKGFAVQQTIIRDNCTEGTWCNDNHICIPSSNLGKLCWQDRECISGTCNDDGVCINGADVFHSIANWLWAIMGCSVFVFVLIILGVLWMLHRYQSRKEHEKAAKFFYDNDEFFKKMQLQQDDTSSAVQLFDYSRSSVVYLTTPDYYESTALGTTRPLSWRHSTSK